MVVRRVDVLERDDVVPREQPRVGLEGGEPASRADLRRRGPRDIPPPTPGEGADHRAALFLGLLDGSLNAFHALLSCRRRGRYHVCL